jgi:hypothetical protein
MKKNASWLLLRSAGQQASALQSVLKWEFVIKSL